ncbi:phage integrase family protein [Oleiphilus messinensis]|uniref:Phage integrase family protein n=1 Tax=Oleiphilus messinensis TaxID=141451 RepID=A0A1Y0I8N2_9GAMM|nr:tyrosine-type recombinase/integrase [Oleiphilus messinensis]ARU56848.1 phage integrase family protein [Oleiphilus messinensis]
MVKEINISPALVNAGTHANDTPLTATQDTAIIASGLSDIEHYLQAATSENTRRTYRSAIRQFEKSGGRLPANRDTLMRYIVAQAPLLNPRTLDLHITAISRWHEYQGFEDPTRDPLLRKTLVGIRRTHGKPKQKAKPLSLQHLAILVTTLDVSENNLRKKRDKALLLTGYFGAFRRSEIVAIQFEDLFWEPEGVIIRITQSKTDQYGEGILRALPYHNSPYCAATALKNWIDESGIQHGPIFRAINRWSQLKGKALHAGAINTLLKELGAQAKFDFVPNLSSHSFRRGLSTAAAREELDFELIKKQGGWKTDDVVRGYIEEGHAFKNNVVTDLITRLDELNADLAP